MSTLIQDVRYAFRTFLRNPGFTVVALLTLALGIGANTAIFSVIDEVMLSPLSMPDPGKIVQLLQRIPGSGMGFFTTSILNFQDYRDRNDVFEFVAGMQAPNPTEFYVGTEERPVKTAGYMVSSSFLPLLGIEPILGRGFLPEDDVPGTPPTVMVTYEFWQRNYGGSSEVIGTTLTAVSPEAEFTIVGVLPPGFQIPPVTHNVGGGFGGKGLALQVPHDFLVSLGPLNPAMLTNPAARGVQFLAVLARLKPGVTLDQAQANINNIASRIAADNLPDFSGFEVTVTPLIKIVQRAYGSGLFFLWAAAGFALLIVCINIANLMLVRAVAREQELAIRMALGSGRGRLLKQLSTESMLLGVMGGAVGLLLAHWGIKILVTLLPYYIYRLDEVSLDSRVLVFTIAITILTSLLFGLLPAIRSVRPNLIEALKEGARGSAGKRLQLHRLLVVVEVALALLLLTGAGLMLSSFRKLSSVDPGFDRENLLVMDVEVLPYNISQYPGPQSVGLLTAIIDRVEAVPGVISAGSIHLAPLTGYRGVMNFTLADRPLPPPSERISLNYSEITPGYMETMGIPLLTGRLFTQDDLDRSVAFASEAQSIWTRYQTATMDEKSSMRRENIIPIIINDIMAQQYWPDGNALGKELYFGEADLEDPPLQLATIVGVVPEVKTKRMDERPRIQIYIVVSYLTRWLMIRTRADSPELTERLKEEVEAVDKTEIKVGSVRFMEGYYLDATAENRCQMVLIMAFAFLAMVLAAIGLFGVMAYSVAQRTHEIGVRMSLGAQPQEIFKLILGQGMLLTVIGIVIGLAGSFVLARYIASLLFEISPINLAISVSVSILLVIVALIACYVPTRHASKVDPVESLRTE